MTLRELKQSLREAVDENGEEVVVIPRHLWEAFVEESHENETITPAETASQVERIRLLLDEWAKEPDDPRWWAEFDQFLHDNPVSLGNPTAVDGDDT